MMKLGLIATILIWTSLGSLALGAKSGDYLVSPYLYTVKGERWAVSWWQKGDRTHKPHLTLSDNGKEIQLEGFQENHLNTVWLALKPCDFGEVSYRIEGEAEFQPIQDIPCPHSKKAARFTFMSDTQQGVSYDRAFTEIIKSFAGQAVLLGGDLVEVGSDELAWHKFFEAMSPALMSQFLVPVIGNHEYHFEKKVPSWTHYFHTNANEDFYAIDIGSVHVMALNSCFEDDPSMRVKQLGWLKGELEKKSSWKVVFFHHPPFSLSIANHPKALKKEYLALQQDYVPLFERYKVALVLNGHTHIYEHSVKQGIHYLTMGPAGGQMGYYGSQNPYALQTYKMRTLTTVEAISSEMKVTVLNLKGEVVNVINLKK